MSARQMLKLIKDDEPVFLAVVRTSDNFVPRSPKTKLSPGYAAVNTAHGMIEGHRRKINKESGPKKDIISVKEREKEVLDSVSVVYRESLEKIIQKYRDVFPEKLPKGVPPNRGVQHRIDIEPGSDPPYRPPYRLGPTEQDELEEQIKISWLRVLYVHRVVRTGHRFYSCPRKTVDGVCVSITERLTSKPSRTAIRFRG